MNAYDHSQAAALLAPLSYSPEDHLFTLSDGFIGFGYLCQPICGADRRLTQNLEYLLNGDWPANTLLQVSLFSSPDIQTSLTAMRSLSEAHSDPLFHEIMEERTRFLATSAHTSLDDRTELTVRDFCLVVTVKMPYEGQEPTVTQADRFKTVQLSVLRGLERAALCPNALTRDSYLRMMSIILKSHENGSSRKPHQSEPTHAQLLRDQVFDVDSTLREDANGLWLGDTRVNLISVKNYPKRVTFGMAQYYVGDVMQGLRGIRSHFIITANLHFPPPSLAIAKLKTRRQWVINQCLSAVQHIAPTLVRRKDDLDILCDAFDEGHRPVRFYMSVALFESSEEAAAKAVRQLQSYWGELGFNLLPDRFITLPLFVNALPFCASPDLRNTLSRYKTMATKHAVPLLPIFAEWKGTGTPSMQFISRNGQLISNCLFDSSTNYNTCIVGSAGSGKTLLTKEIITSYLLQNGRCWVVAPDRSYQTLCKVYGGSSIRINQGFCRNPFSIITDYDDECDVLVSLIAAMASPLRTLSASETAGLCRIMRKVWGDLERQMTLDDLVVALLTDEDCAINNIGHNLHAFTSRGEYGDIFAGNNELPIDTALTVLNIEDLNGHTRLRQAVLLNLIFQIQKEMYLDRRLTKKLLVLGDYIDFADADGMAPFIKHAYRRFRPYGASVITVTSSIPRLLQTNAGRSVFETSANLYLLPQSVEDVYELKRRDLLPIIDQGYELLRWAHTVAGRYSEVFMVSDYGAGVGRLFLDPFRRVIYSEHTNRYKKDNQSPRNVEQGASQSNLAWVIHEGRDGAD